MATPDRPAWGNSQEVFWNTAQTGGAPSLPGAGLADAHANAAGANDCTLTPSAATKTAYLSGFWVGGLGATGASTIDVTVTGLAGGATLSFPLRVVAGATTALTPVFVSFPQGLPASGQNVAIVVAVPSFGAGNLTAEANAWGYELPGTATAAGLADAHTNAHAANDCTLTPSAATKTAFLQGFWIGGLGATGASTISVTVTGLLGGTLTFTMSIPAGAGTAVTPLFVTFPQGLPASAVNTPIVVHVPSFGAGNLTAEANAWGYEI